MWWIRNETQVATNRASLGGLTNVPHEWMSSKLPAPQGTGLGKEPEDGFQSHFTILDGCFVQC